MKFKIIIINLFLLSLLYSCTDGIDRKVSYDIFSPNLNISLEEIIKDGFELDTFEGEIYGKHTGDTLWRFYFDDQRNNLIWLKQIDIRKGAFNNDELSNLILLNNCNVEGGIKMANDSSVFYVENTYRNMRFRCFKSPEDLHISYHYPLPELEDELIPFTGTYERTNVRDVSEQP